MAPWARCMLGIGFLILTSLGHVAKAEEGDLASPAFQFFPKVETVFPVLIGGGVGLAYSDHFQIGLMYGVTPQSYYSVIGKVAADFGNNPAYEDVITAAFQNNGILRFDLQYNFSVAPSGWRIGLAFSRLTSSGKAGIDKVLAASTGNDYTNLKNFLTLAGRSTEVDMTSTLLVAEVNVGYAWSLPNNFSAFASLGAGKVVNSEVLIKTGLPNFEASAAGSSLLRTTESDIEAIINQYGISPTVGFGLSYML